jgi:hypothetical protein
MDKIKLTSAEIAGVWFTYIANTMSRCITKHFQAHVEDAVTKQPIICITCE